MTNTSDPGSVTPSALPEHQQLRKWLAQAHEENERLDRRALGRCQYCGNESHHSTNGACDFTYRAEVRLQPHLVASLLAEREGLQQQVKELKEQIARGVESGAPLAPTGSTATSNEKASSVRQTVQTAMKVLLENITVAVIEDHHADGSAFVALGKEQDYAAQGNTVAEALWCFRFGYLASVLLQLERGASVFTATPDDVWREFTTTNGPVTYFKCSYEAALAAGEGK